MKTILLLSCLTSVFAVEVVPLYHRQSWFKVTSPHFTTCIASTGVDPIAAHNSILKCEFLNDSKLKWFINCLQQKLNLMDSTGEFVEKEFVRQISGATAEITKKCIDKTKDELDICKKGFDMYLCLVYSLGKPNDGQHS